jgi:hypothetical protein
MTTHVVLLDSAHGPYAYGPFDEKENADQFASFLSAEVDPARVLRLIPPIDEMYGWWRNRSSALTPANWPPRHGDIWQDQKLNRWSCQQDGTLACLAHKADDTAAEINRVYGPLTIVYRPNATEEESPF